MEKEEPRRIGLVWPLIIVACVAIPLALVIALLGDTPQTRADRLDQKALIITVAVAVFIVETGAAFPIRQWRRGEEKPETVREIIKDGTQRVREIHYGMPPRAALGHETQVDPLAFPAMTRAAYQAGTQSSGTRAMAPLEDWPAEATDGVDDVPPPAGWTGEIVQ